MGGDIYICDLCTVTLHFQLLLKELSQGFWWTGFVQALTKALQTHESSKFCPADQDGKVSCSLVALLEGEVLGILMFTCRGLGLEAWSGSSRRHDGTGSPEAVWDARIASMG